ncbi:hypothetical protein PPACK8108_LOCUS4534 [Phakopsora pachyrhizi]|uniref:Homeobox domain-containing protein n=1 Tax=Phakopsora pachyrhizi TaxID=170000 RepID=A0AAV0AP22_PHAPC|nr:hypothetical protein PPACK8108_LOCUS4534 [Phakopsora pachyrhizi]
MAAAAASLKAFQENCFQDYSSSIISSHSGSNIETPNADASGTTPTAGSTSNLGSDGPKPFSLPSLSSITSKLSSSSSPSSEASHFGPHRSSQNFNNSITRRFSPLSTSIDSHDLISPLDSERSGFSWTDRRMSISGTVAAIASGNRPRSRSILSGHSLSSAIQPECDLLNDESASDSGGSDKKRDCDDSELSNSAKKRSRTLTTPSQQRRLIQILEQTRFPSTELREQLARELGMTPRRVQIWFQNRRQGMKKAMEHKPEQDPTSSTSDYNRTRGYSFGAYPTPPSDLYAQTRPSAGNSFGSGPLPVYGGSSIGHSVQGSMDPYVGSQLYAPRALERSSLPRQLGQLQLVTNSTSSSNDSTTGADFAWSESSGASTAYSLSSAIEREGICPPFGKSSNGNYESSNSTNFGTHQPASRNRSQTNPGFFVSGGLSSLPGLGHLSNHASNPAFNAADSKPIQRFSNLESDSSPSKVESWSSTYSQPVWPEEIRDLKLESTPYNSSGSSSDHISTNQSSIYPTQIQPSSGLYYHSSKVPTPSGLSQAYSLVQKDSLPVEDYESSYDDSTAQNLRQRTRSFTG